LQGVGGLLLGRVRGAVHGAEICRERGCGLGQRGWELLDREGGRGKRGRKTYVLT
jgi:hypothetical protein